MTAVRTDKPLTDEQRAALETRRVSVALDAGAGCGKTFVLTERFLSHLDPADGEETPTPLDEIVAITFTDAAAREMRDRIRRTCRERYESADKEKRPFWHSLIRSLDAARVSTIHSFCADLVRNHAIELGIDPAFRVADAAEAQVLLGDTIDSLLRDRLSPSDGAADPLLIDTAALFGVSGLRDRLRTLVSSASDPSFSEWANRTPQQSIEAWRTFYRDEVAPRYAEEIYDHPAVREILELAPQATPRPAFAQRLQELREAIEELRESQHPDGALQKLMPLLYVKDPETGKFVYTKKDWPDDSLKERFTAALKTLRGRLDKQRREGSPESMLRAAETGLGLLKLAAAAAQRYRDRKRSAGVLDQDDLLVEARRLLTDPVFEPARRRVASRVSVLLVDEFQDTDRTQVDIVRAIVGDAPDAPLGGGKLFFVGDFKQSIYRFRGAEPAVFRELRESAAAEGRLPLSKNFRSQPAVLDFVNSLFGELFGASYTPLRAAREQTTPRPAVELLWTPAPEPAEASAKKVTVEDQRRAEAQALAARLRAMIDSGELLVADKEGQARPVKPGDIALLFRALSNVALYEDALRSAGLDYYLVGGHAFYAQQEVFDITNLLRSIASPCDDIALAGVLRSPLFGLSDESLFWLAEKGGPHLARLNRGLFAPQPPSEIDPQQRGRVVHAKGVLGELREMKDRCGAAKLLRCALDKTDYEAALLAEFLGERKLANLEKLHEQARQSDATGEGLAGFLRRLSEFVDRPPKEALAATSTEESDAVRLMTVHQAKGLEFPVVVLPDLERKLQGERATAAFDRRLGPLVKLSSDDQPVGIDFYRATENAQAEAEQDRLFYVACTRAADRLILSACLDDPAKAEGPWLKRLAKRFDLTTGERIGPPREDEPDEPLVTVAPPIYETSSQGASRQETSITKVLEQVDTLGKVSSAVPEGVAPIALRSEDLMTFSVSRLNGRLHQASTYSSEIESGAGADEEPVDARRLGTLTHAVLERIDPVHDDPQEQIRHWAESLGPSQLRRGVKRGVAECVDMVTRFVANKRWKSMIGSSNFRRESEFLMNWPPSDQASDRRPRARLNGYIDALYQDSDGGWRIVDYKTNLVTEQEVPTVAEQYRMQLSVYALAVEAALGVRPVELVLAFLRPGVEHTFAWGDDERTAAIGEIDQAIRDARASTVTNIETPNG